MRNRIGVERILDTACVPRRIHHMFRVSMLGLALFAASFFVGNSRATVLDFNNLQPQEQILDYYNGGFGNMGSGPGPNYGITFSPDFITTDQGVSFGPEALQGATLTTTMGVMDVEGGFSGFFSFYYVSTETENPDSVILYSGLDGTGLDVGTFALPAVGLFSPAGLLAPEFHSAVFLGAPDTLVIDNVTSLLR
jgi:hypothetical protein